MRRNNIVIVSKNGQIVIPIEIRRNLKIMAKDRIFVIQSGESIILQLIPIGIKKGNREVL